LDDEEEEELSVQRVKIQMMSAGREHTSNSALQNMQQIEEIRRKLLSSKQY